jgi:hypothetical protein
VPFPPLSSPFSSLLEELKEKHPHWPWALLLPHTALTNTDYAFIAIESGRFVDQKTGIFLTFFLFSFLP